MDVERLFSKHRTELVRYLIRYTGDPELAEDAVQEAYLRLVVHPPQTDSNLRAWLYRVATNVVRDDWKRRHTEALLAEQFPGLPRPESPERAVDRWEARRVVRRALAELGGRERAILLMRLEGFSHVEIAAAVGTTPQSVGTMATRALRRLAEVLGRL